MRRLLIRRLGLVEYEDGLALMRLAADAIRGAHPPETDHLFLLEHPPVLTLGRGAGRGNIVATPAWLERRGWEVHETDRGGDVTWHGPGQLVAYPVMQLGGAVGARRFVEALEAAMILTCGDFGLAASRHPEHRGAWIGPRKVGAVGVHLARGMTRHGLALNVSVDLEQFQAIVPCGIADPRLGVTSVDRELRERGLPPADPGGVAARLATHLATALGREGKEEPVDVRTVSVVPVGADGRVLLLRRSPERGGFWQPVTGRIEAGEAPIDAARRELGEETGADAAVAPLGYRHAFPLDPALVPPRRPGLRICEETAFVAALPPGFVPRLSEEHVAFEWCTPGEAAIRPRYAGLRRAIRLATTCASMPNLS
ncbi:MAG TPA: lipoyl(octanoyl) transferase LipB [Anaeromyxobacteraceae bacterium]|nr:lipoyl(octanoyl) transferase LipB [Anaeromyxobacteraceae bacterium]